MEDLAWAITELRKQAKIIGGDICGAYSTPSYARWGQKFASEFDHPGLEEAHLKDAGNINARALSIVWPALTTGN